MHESLTSTPNNMKTWNMLGKSIAYENNQFQTLIINPMYVLLFQGSCAKYMYATISSVGTSLSM